MYFNMSRHRFGYLQSQLFPKYFMSGVCLSVVSLASYCLMHPMDTWEGRHKIQVIIKYQNLYCHNSTSQNRTRCNCNQKYLHRLNRALTAIDNFYTGNISNAKATIDKHSQGHTTKLGILCSNEQEAHQKWQKSSLNIVKVIQKSWASCALMNRKPSKKMTKKLFLCGNDLGL